MHLHPEPLDLNLQSPHLQHPFSLLSWEEDVEHIVDAGG
jgi:hypothetical protein